MRLLLAALERLQMDVRPLIDGMPVSEQELRAPGRRIDWDVWVELLERLQQNLGGPQALQQFASPGEALKRADGEAIDLLLTDVIMPEISGAELARLLTKRRPELAVLYMSGYAEDEIVHRGVVDPGVSLLPKPFGPDSLARAVRKQLDDHSFSQRKSS